MLPAETALAIIASFLILARFRPIATPTPFADSTVVPSAMTSAWFSELLATRRSPEIVADVVEL